MGEEEMTKYGCWGLSLSLRPPITNLDQKLMSKTEPHLSTYDDEGPKLHKPNNNRLIIMPKIMGVEIKPTPLVIDLEEIEIGKVSSPNSTLSTTSAKGFGGFGSVRDAKSDEDDGGNSGGITSDGGRRRGERRKLRLSKEQIVVLEQAFREHTSLNTKQKVALAKQVNLRPRQVEVWFQNRRARTKLKQTEVDCENLRRLSETLIEENRKIQRELQDMRVLKSSQTALALCPSCKSVSTATTKSPVGEPSHSSAGLFYRPVPLNLKKLSLSSNRHSMLESSNLPSSSTVQKCLRGHLLVQP